MKIGIVYFSDTNVTAQLADAIARGIRREQLQIVMHRITNSDIVDGVFVNDALIAELTDCDAIAFGSPTYMGSAAAQFKAFADRTGEFWSEHTWADKLAIGFTSGTGMNGDQTGTLHFFFTLASQHGMIWVGLDKHDQSGVNLNRMGNQKGIVAHAPEAVVDTVDLATAEYLGARLARLVKRFG